MHLIYHDFLSWRWRKEISVKLYYEAMSNKVTGLSDIIIIINLKLVGKLTL